MSIMFTHGDIFDAEVEALVNPVNCVGVAGAGLAKAFKERYPVIFSMYARFCTYRLLYPGRVLTVGLGADQKSRCIIHFPTKRHWKDKTRIEDIIIGIDALISELNRFGIRSAAIPALGCGLGELRWSVVATLLSLAFEKRTDIDAVAYYPHGPTRQGELQGEDLFEALSRRPDIVEQDKQARINVAAGKYKTLAEIRKELFEHGS